MQKETWQNGDNECEKKRTLDKTENNFKKKSRRKRGFLGQPVRRRLKRSKRLNHDPPTRVHRGIFYHLPSSNGREPRQQEPGPGGKCVLVKLF